MIYWGEGGWHLPDGEEHLQDWMRKVGKWRTSELDGARRLLYQGHKYERAMKLNPDRSGLAVDVGAHVGLWTWQMAQDFARVVAFEPVAEHRQCWDANMSGLANVELQPFALGAEPGRVRLQKRTPGSSGDTGVDPIAERSSLRASVDDVGEECELRTLDSFGLEGVALVKLDCEGYEYHVLRGARETLTRCRPVIVVEQKLETGMEARYGLKPEQVLDWLAGIGAKHRGAVQGDHFFSFA